MKYPQKLKDLLDEKVELYNCRKFIETDPICIPHSFSTKQDIEIMGFFASVFAWGQRKTIINKCKELTERLDGKPYEFIKNHRESDLKNLLGFKHRTFNDTDLLYFFNFLHRHYSVSDTLEEAFVPSGTKNVDVEQALTYFYTSFFNHPDAPDRTRKHISTPAKKSACKRLNMFLRWMVRKDEKGVDFGIWEKIQPKDLICPLDVHVDRAARILELLTRDKADWQAAMELTQNLRQLDPQDPVKYDYALFGLSCEERIGSLQ